MVVAFFLWAAPAAPEVTRWPSVNLALAGFFMVAVINAFNLIDGLDGLAAGVGIAATGAIGVVAWWSRDVGLACAALAAGGTLGGFLFFNFYIFSGKDRRMRLVGFVDDDAFKEGKLVHGHQVLGA